MAADLTVEWTGICSLLRTACSSDFGLEIEFSTDPATLREAVVDFDWQNDVQHIQLPTPTLVGIPQDQDGYDLLYAGYVAQILRPYLWATFSQTCYEGELL